MQTAPNGFFDKKQINETDASTKLPFFPPAFSGLVRVDSCKGITKRGTSEKAYIVEFTVLTSNLANLAPNDPNYVAIGSRRSWYQSLKETGTAYPACIAFLQAAMGLAMGRDQAKIEELKPQQYDYLELSMTDNNPLADQVVALQTSEKKKKAGAAMTIEQARATNNVFTLHSFSPGPEQAATQNAA